MKIEYEKPWFLKPKLGEDQTNIVMNSSYTISLSFNVGENYKKDNKIGFFGIPGKNFGVGYDYVKKLFVFEFWTKDSKGSPVFNCYTYESITEKMYNKKTNITLTYNGSEYKIFFDFKLLDLIKSDSLLIDDYINEPIYIGCHNIDSINQSHKNLTEMDAFHFSIFKTPLSINEVKMFVNNTNRNLNKFSDNLLCVFDFESQTGDEFIILDDYKDKYFLKKKNKNSSIGFEIAKKKLDDVGCGFCLAKWTQVTMHLHNGTTHSCHHPEPHKVSLEELSRNPTALHNSKIKKIARKEMLENKRPSECSYCWNVEDNSTSFSDRVFKSSEPWSEPFFDEISKSDWRDNYNPKYVEVSFSNTCNFKCAYCGPEYSSKWMEEINDHGPYKLSFDYNGTKRMEERNTKPYKHSEDNPYVNSFWEWFPELYQSMDTFRITGGEPLLSKDTWKVLDFILETDEPNRNLKLSINSNLGVPDNLIDRLIEKLDKIIKNNLVKEIMGLNLNIPDME
jgi:hypothetical protein